MTRIRLFVILGCFAALPERVGSVEVTIDRSQAEDSVTFAVFGDYGTGESVSQIVKLAEPDFILSTGDGNYGDTSLGSPDWESQIGRLYGDFIRRRGDDTFPSQTATEQRFFPTVGNHDVGIASDQNGTRAGYLDYFVDTPSGPNRLPGSHHSFERSYYSLRRGDIHLFSLDSQAIVHDVAVEEQLAWLATEAAESDALWKFAIFHHPAYSSGPHGSHAALQFPFGQIGMDAVFSGHDHVYERIALDTNYLTVGTGGVGLYPFQSEPIPGSQFRYNDEFGALFATVTGATAKFQFVNVNGELVDQFVLVVPEPSTCWLLVCCFVGSLGWLRNSRTRVCIRKPF